MKHLRSNSVLLLLSGLLTGTAMAVRDDATDQGSGKQEPSRARGVAVRQATPAQRALADAAERAGYVLEWDHALSVPGSVRGEDLSRRQAFSSGKGLRVSGQGRQPEDAIAILDNVSGIFRIKDAEREFKERQTDKDRLGFQHVRLNQMHDGLRVVGGELIVHFNKAGRAYQVNGRYVPDVAAGIVPAISAADALATARTDQAARGLPVGTPAGEPELVVYALTDPPRLAYELVLSYKSAQAGPGRWSYWIDAQDGTIIDAFNGIAHIPAPTTNGSHVTVTGSLLTGEGGGVTNVQAWYDNINTSFYLYNTNRQWIIENVAASGYPDANTYAYRTTNDWGTSDRAEISLALNFHLTQRYYFERHGLFSFNGAGIIARANAHEGIAYVNAYWDGSEFYFGDGDGATANSLATMDIAGHEFTHAVTEYSAGLIYSYESGALNESFSDVLGSCVEFFGQTDDRASYPVENPGLADWLLGEDAWISSTSLRDMRNPANPITVGAGNEQPTRYLGTYWYTGTGDNGGVHQNSGVQNFYFYLLCDGGSGNNDGIAYNVTGIGITNAEQIAYRALTVYCTANTGYRAVRTAWLSAAQDLDPAWATSVGNAWDAVGVQAVYVLPLTDANFSGEEGGPFSPATYVYRITNTSASAVGWGASHTQVWATVAPSGGVLAAFGGQSVTVTINAAAGSLSDGTYYDTVKFTNSASSSSESRSVSLLVLPPAIYTFDLSTDPGWTTEGQWAYGAPLGLAGDPSSGFTGPNVYGYNLAGAYAGGIPEYFLTSTALDCSAHENILLQFQRWLGVDSSAFDHARIYISTNGTTWSLVWDHVGTLIQDTVWQSVSYDISAMADGAPTVYLRWGMGPTDLSFAYSGWNIDDIRVRGTALDGLRAVPGDGLSSVGYQGGPFSPTSKVYEVSNRGTNDFNWTAGVTSSWVDVSPSGGSLGIGATTTVQVALTAAADGLATGTYHSTMTFSNSSSGFKTTRAITLQVKAIPGEIEVFDSILPDHDTNMPFGQVIIELQRREYITVTNTDTVYPLVISDISVSGIFGAPFQLEPTPLQTSVRSETGAQNSLASSARGPSAVRWSTAPPHPVEAPQILIYADDAYHVYPNTFVDQALQALGMTYTAHYDMDFTGFENSLTTGGPWDLVIFAGDNYFAPTTTFDDLLTYVNGGGRSIVHSWNVSSGHLLWNALGVSFFSNDGDPPNPVYWWDADHPFFNTPESVPQFTMLSGGLYGVYGQQVNPIGDGVAVAGYTVSPSANNATLVIANEGRTIFRGFLDGQNSADIDSDSKPDGMELWINLITHALSASKFRLENLPVLPHSIAPGTSVTFDVVYEPDAVRTNYGQVTIESNDDDEPVKQVNLSGEGIEDFMNVFPTNGLSASGHPGGPFSASNIVYELTNNSASFTSWAAGHTQAWVTVSPGSGTLPAGGSESVTVSLNAAANALGEGTYGDTVLFSNVTTGITQARSVSLTVITSPMMLVSPTSMSVTNRVGESKTNVLTVSNLPGADGDLTFRLSSRNQGSSPLPFAGGTFVSHIPAGIDFTQAAAGKEFVPGELLVRFAEGVTGAARTSLLASLGGGESRREYRLVPGLVLLKLAPGVTTEEALQSYNGTPGVIYAVPNYVVHVYDTFPDDAQFSQLWGLHNTGQSGGTVDADIDAPAAWDLVTGDANVIVGVVDTGIDYHHEDLSGNMWVNPGEIPGNLNDDDFNGYVDDVYGINAITGSGDPMDDHDHGTHCSGTIGGFGNNAVGVAGVNWRIRLMGLKFLNAGGSGTTADAITCIEYGTLMGARVLSNSWGGGPYDQGLKDAIDAAAAAEIVFAAAAGNANSNNDVIPNYPSNYESSNMVAVMATDRNDAKSSFSSYGQATVDLAAPGTDILSCRRGGGYVTFSGTSMATPHVAGAAALLMAVNPFLTVQEIKDALMSTVDVLFPTLCVSGGRLNLDRALDEVGLTWLTMEPMAVTNMPPGSSTNIQVGFHADALEPAIYQGEIVVRGNDLTNPVVMVPVTMTVLPDELRVQTTNGLISTGYTGGPFLPTSIVYTVANGGASPLGWTATCASNWVTVDPPGGTLAVGETNQTVVSINSNANNLGVGIYPATVLFGNVDSGSIQTRGVTLTVLGEIGFDAAAYTVDESAGTAVITVLRNGNTNLAVTVDFATSNGTATAGNDYAATNGTLAFAPGQVSNHFEISILNDELSEGNETVHLRLDNPTGGGTLSDPNSATLAIVDDDLPTAVYLRSTAGAPWNSTNNEAAMNRVFGAGNWQDLRYETVDTTNQLFTGTTFIFMEGGDDNALEMEAFLSAHSNAVRNWVSAGGRLFLNAAPNEGDGMSFGFGVSLIYADYTSTGAAVDTNHPIFRTPFTPVGNLWSGSSFGHATVSGSGLTALITNTLNGNIVLAEKEQGAGRVLFGGMTTPNFHTPQPQADNLRANIIAYSSTPTDALNVAPGTGFASAGYVGGPFTPSNTLYTLVNLGSTDLTWAASCALAWVTVDPAGGILPAEATNVVIVSINTNANSLGVGTYHGDVLFSNVNSGAIQTREVTLTVQGEIRFDTAAHAALESAGTAVITVLRGGNTNQAVTVDFATSNGTAAAGSDYLATNGTLAFAAGQVSNRFEVSILNDALGEGGETINLRLSNPTGGGTLGDPNVATLVIVDDDLPGAVYLRSVTGAPWSVTNNEAAMNRVFGAGNWQDLRYETVVPANLLSSITTFIFMEGGDNNGLELEAFLSANSNAVQGWVNAGGRLFLNAAPNEGDGMSFGFGVTLNYPEYTSTGAAVDTNHPIFRIPFTPVGNLWNGGYFGHATVSGSGLTALITNTLNGEILLAEKEQGAGRILFGGMTTANFHTPQPQAENLRANIIAYSGMSVVIPVADITAVAGSPVITADPVNQNNIGDAFDLATNGGFVTTTVQGGFGSFGQVYVNYDATNLYLGAHGLDVVGDNNFLALFVGMNTLSDDTTELASHSGLPLGLDNMHNLSFGSPMDIAILLGDEWGDGTFPNFNLGSGADVGQGVFYLPAGGFLAVADAGVSQFDGTGTNATVSTDDDGNRLTDRWEVSLPWSALDASNIGSITSLQVVGVFASDGISGNDRYISGNFLGTSATGTLDGFSNYAFSTVTVHSVNVKLPAPEIAVLGTNGALIADGDTTPSATDGSHFGSADVTADLVTRTFGITNSGPAELIVTGVTTTGTHAADFMVMLFPTTVSPGARSNFVVRFDPSALGARTATVVIANNDADEAAYDFAVQGTGITAQPEIAVLGTNGALIADGDTTPSAADGTLFVATDVGTGLVTRTFGVTNSGFANLVVTGVTTVGTHAADFMVMLFPATVSPGTRSNLVVRFDPSAIGVRSATVIIVNNDPDESNYDFAVRGIGVPPPQPPEVWINELNYDSPGVDSNEFVEIAGLAGMDLSNFQLVLYNGSVGTVYSNKVLTGTITNEGCGYGAEMVLTPALQNGAPDGVALARVTGGATSLVQFLSYEGSFIAVGGPADGQTSENIGSQVANGMTLQQAGSGTNYSQFTWVSNVMSRASLNVGQTILPCSSGDSDSDGMPDAWELLYGLNPAASNPAGSNADADWMTDLQEYWADTNPTNGLSYFSDMIVTNTPIGTIMFVIFPTSTARVYQVHWCTNLPADPQSWQPYGHAWTGTADGLSFIVTNDAPQRIYRTGVRLP